MTSCCIRYGNVVMLNIGGIHAVFLHGYSTVKEAFAQHQYSARPTFYLTRSIVPGEGEVK